VLELRVNYVYDGPNDKTYMPGAHNMVSRTLKQPLPKPQADRLCAEYKLIFKLRDLIRQGKPAKNDNKLPKELIEKLNALKSHFKMVSDQLGTPKKPVVSAAGAPAVLTIGSVGWLPSSDRQGSEPAGARLDYECLLSCFSELPAMVPSLPKKRLALHFKLYLVLMKHVFLYAKSSDILNMLWPEVLAKATAVAKHAPIVLRVQLSLILDIYKAYLKTGDFTAGWTSHQINTYEQLSVLFLPERLLRYKTTATQFKCYVQLVKQVVSRGHLPAFLSLLDTLPDTDAVGKQKQGYVRYKVAVSQAPAMVICYKLFRGVMVRKQHEQVPALSSPERTTHRLDMLPMSWDVSAANDITLPATQQTPVVNTQASHLEAMTLLVLNVKYKFDKLGKLARYFQSQPSRVSASAKPWPLLQVFQVMGRFSPFKRIRSVPSANDRRVATSANDALTRRSKQSRA